MIDSDTTKHRWKFFRASGLEQVLFEKGSDLGALSDLDQKLWVALSSPAKGLEFDTKTLELIDTDKDGRIRAPEVIAAANWAVWHLKKPDELLNPGQALPLSLINDQHESGARILAGAKQILKNLGKAGTESINVEEVADTSKIFAQTQFNGDGIIPADAASEPAIRQVIEEIIATLGAVADRSGKPGIDTKKTDLFFAEAQALADWHTAGETNRAISPLGDKTTDAFNAYASVRNKVDDYFARCELAAFDPRATAPLNRSETEFAAMAIKELTVNSEDIARLPLAHVAADKSLPLDRHLNPAWTGAMHNFRTLAVLPLLGERTELTRSDWASLQAKFTEQESWLMAKPKTATEKLGVLRLREILAGKSRSTIAALIVEDLRLEVEHNQIAAVDRLVRYYRDLHTLLKNFVNFSDYYNPNAPAIFQTGTLYVDGRSCDLCVSVDDVAKHSTLATSGGIYLAYCELNRIATGQKRNICAAITSGFAETLYVGRNGLFYDRAGRDWDATIIKVIEHQISLKEAFWSPWKKISRMISDQINKMLAAREAAALSAAGKGVEDASKTVAEGGKPAAPAPAAANSGAAMASSVAAIGIAVGILGTAVGKLMEFVKDATLLNIILGVFCVIGAVSFPSVVIAYFKLRKRDIAPILNACGWAINRRIRLTLKLGSVLTQEAKLPVGSERKLLDPYAEANGRRNFLLILLIVCLTAVLWRFGQFDKLLPVNARSTSALSTNAPTPAPAPVPTNAPAK